jgi:outer membrane lipoprotein-sorting protein
VVLKNMAKMKLLVAFLSAVLVGLAPAVHAQAPKKPSSSVTLEQVLGVMDTAAAGFKSAQANFVWEQYQKVVNDTDIQKGVIYFRRSGKDVQMAADIRDPAKKYVLYADSKVQVYQPSIDQVTQYAAGKNKADFESFLVLGFGGAGHDLQRSFEVTVAGTEAVDGADTARLDLTPKSEKVRGMFNKISLWVDLKRGVSVKQQFFEPSGDYRLTRYSDIKMNEKLPSDAFKLKTTGKTKYLNPQG